MTAKENTDNVGDGGALELNNLKAIATGVVDGHTYIFAGGNDDGISVFELNDDGTLTSVFNIADTGALELNNIRDIAFTEVGGNPMLVVVGGDDAVSTFDVADDGSLTEADQIDQSGSLLLDNGQAVTTVTVGGNTYVVTGNSDNNSNNEGVSTFSLDSSGNLAFVDQIAEGEDSGNLELNGVRALASGEAGGTTYVIAGGSDDGLSVFSVNASGILTNVFNISDGNSPDLPGENLELNNVRAITTASVGGTTYVYAGGDDDGISVFTLNNDGSLTHVHDYEDGGALELGNLKSLTVATSQSGQQYLWVVGDDDALQSFTIGNDGSLTLHTTFQNDGSNYLGNAEDVVYTMIDGEMVAVAGGDEDGLSVFTVPCFTAGTLIATPLGPRRVEALNAGDLILTADNGPQPVRFVAMCRLSPARLAECPHLRPVRIPAGAIAPGVPERELVVSPKHRMLLRGPRLGLMLAMDEAMADADALVGHTPAMRAMGSEGVTYVHIGLARHEVIFANGAPTESLFPGDQALGAMGAAARAELIELFPDLATGLSPLTRPARPFLKRFEARALLVS